MVFSDLTDWTIVQNNGWPDYPLQRPRSHARLCRSLRADVEFLLENGVKFKEIAPDNQGGHNLGNSAPRENHAFWTKGAGYESPNNRPGTGVIRPLENSARAKGVKFLLNYKMTSLRPRKPEARRGYSASTPSTRRGSCRDNRRLEELSFRRQYRQHATDPEHPRQERRDRRHRRHDQRLELPPHVRSAVDRSADRRRRTLQLIRTPAASSPPWRSARRFGVW